MKTIFALLIASLFPLTSMAQKDLPYRVFKGDGTEVQLDTLLNAIEHKDIVFFGEQHNCPIAHWCEVLILKYLYEKCSDVTVGMEMFEADVQCILNEFMEGLISEESFFREARPWHNYETDYMALVDFAKEHKLPLVATNVPRRYADAVHKKGLSILESFDTVAKSYITPLPFVPEKSSEVFFSAMLSMSSSEENADRVQRLQAAQSLKDATMAHFIIRNKRPQVPFLHINGSYHTMNRGGIVYYLEEMAPTLAWISIATVRQEEITLLDDAFIGSADYLVVVRDEFPRSY